MSKKMPGHTYTIEDLSIVQLLRDGEQAGSLSTHWYPCIISWVRNLGHKSVERKRVYCLGINEARFRAGGGA